MTSKFIQVLACLSQLNRALLQINCSNHSEVEKYRIENICCYSVAKLWPALCNPMDSCTPRVPCPSVSQSLLIFMSTESVILFNHLIRFCLQSFPASGSFPMSPLFYIRWSEYWNFSISPSNKYSGLTAFRIDWFDLHVVEGNLKSLLWHHSLKESVLRCSAFLMVCISQLYMTTGKTIEKHTS